jgi:hypothetical protein
VPVGREANDRAATRAEKYSDPSSNQAAISQSQHQQPSPNSTKDHQHEAGILTDNDMVAFKASERSLANWAIVASR